MWARARNSCDLTKWLSRWLKWVASEASVKARWSPALERFHVLFHTTYMHEYFLTWLIDFILSICPTTPRMNSLQQEKYWFYRKVLAEGFECGVWVWWLLDYRILLPSLILFSERSYNKLFGSHPCPCMARQWITKKTARIWLEHFVSELGIHNCYQTLQEFITVNNDPWTGSRLHGTVLLLRTEQTRFYVASRSSNRWKTRGYQSPLTSLKNWWLSLCYVYDILLILLLLFNSTTSRSREVYILVSISIVVETSIY